MAGNLNSRILLVPSSKDLGVDIIKRITKIEEGADEEYIEWNISNKYYTAKVHFHRAAWRTLADALEPGIPAVVVLWEKGEDYEYILGRYTTEWEGLNAEVKLAVAVGHGSIETEKVEDFCSEVGFEFVDAGDELVEEGSENAGLSRVIEALQTVMWPSMQMKQQTRTHRSQQSIERAKLPAPAALEETDIGKEKEKLNAWLDSNDPWPPRTSSSTGTNTFDDDFADFVSGSSHPVEEAAKSTAATTTESSSQAVVLAAEEEEESHDFQTAEDEDYKELLDDEMPTTEEIMLASQRIFGQSMASREGDEGEEDGEFGDFDLGSLMGALASMKEEIAGITDEEEKRKAAARVALGLVWGLEGGRGM